MNPEKKDAIAAYYKKDFPSGAVHGFFAAAHACMEGQTLDRREWGIETLEGVFVRWEGCDSAEALQKLVSKWDTGKLNVGAVYDVPVRERKKRTARIVRAIAREFVIDVDLDDYGDVDKDDLEGCDRYWPVVAVALTTVRKVFETAYGFRHFMLVYSGRRGGHLWVCDRRAREMDNEKRAAVIAFLQKTMKGGTDQDGTPVHRDYDWVRDHPNLRPMIGHVVRFFEQLGVHPEHEGGVGMLDDVYQREQFLASIGDKIANKLIAAVRPKTGRQALQLIKSHIRRECPAAQNRYEDAVLGMVFPRMDVNVSKDMGHMLKAPFSVHPNTGRVSVPLPLNCDATRWHPSTGAPDVQRLRNQEANDVDKLRQAVETMNALREAILASNTEHHTLKAAAEGLGTPPTKRQRVVSFVGNANQNSGCSVDVLSTDRRICWQLLRTFNVVRYACNPDEMIIEMCTGRSRTNFVHTIEPGQHPPFVHDERSLEKRIDNLYGAVSACWHAPTNAEGFVAFHGEARHFIQIVKDRDKETAEEHFFRLMNELGMPQEIARVQWGWEEHGIKSALRMHFSELLSRELQTF